MSGPCPEAQGHVAQCSVWPWVKAARDVVKAEPRAEPDHMPVMLLPWLYLSDMPSVLALSTTRQHQEREHEQTAIEYTAVLTTNKMWNADDIWKLTAQLSDLDIDHGYVGGVDIIGYDMMKYHWEDACAFITAHLKQAASKSSNRKPKIVVHCAAGTNRSALIAGAAMIAFSPDAVAADNQCLNFLDVIRILKKQRGVVLNNVWFIQQLAEFAQKEGRLGPKPSGYNDDPLRKSELVF
jgi:protein-tyrosine phosphatase